MQARGGAPCRRDSPTSFTLLELLVVVAIMVIMTALIIPSLKGIVDGINITGAADQVASTIALARERATSSSHDVSIRFFQSGNGMFTSYQIWEQPNLSGTATQAYSGMQQLPTGLMVIPGTFSPILNITAGTTYAEFFFRPDGSIAVPTASAYLTLCSKNAPKTGVLVPGLPANFATITIQPLNGTTDIIRP